MAILLKYAKLDAGKLPVELVGDSGRSIKIGLCGNGERGDDGLLDLIKGEKLSSSEDWSCLCLFCCGEVNRRCRALRSEEA